MKKIEINYDELYELYINQNLSINQVADKLNVSYRTIQRAVKNFDLTKNQEQRSTTRKQTNLNKYGVENTYQKEKRVPWNKGLTKNSDKRVAKYSSSNKGKHRTEEQKQRISEATKLAMSRPEVKEKIKDNINNFHLDNPETIKKRTTTIKNKYGLQSKYYGVNYDKYYKYKDILYNKVELSNAIDECSNVLKYTPTALDLANYLKCSPTLVYNKIKEYDMLNKINFSQNKGVISGNNRKISELLTNNNILNELEFHIKNKSYDIHILNTNILLEINPTYTHNSTNVVWFHNSNREPIPKDYHYNKTLLAKDDNYRCIHIWDWDDINKIIMLLKPKQKLYARKCKIKEVNLKDCDKFLNMYHLQNTCKGQDIRLGLYYNDELVQIMTFGKPRYNKNYEYELLRLCTKPEYIVVGGSERLFNHFIKSCKPTSIISYCDNSKFNGDVYFNLGFRLKDFGQPAKHWFNGIKHITDNLLRQRGFDQLFNANYGKGTSNEVLMIEYRVCRNI